VHIAPFDNRNRPIVDVDHDLVPLDYFNIVRLKKGEVFDYAVPGYETCVVPATGTPDLDVVQYGSDDTKTHRKIKHILGAKYHDRVGRLLVSELFTVGQGGWSGFPSHKHDTDRLPDETRHDETYNFRFRPNYGSGLQMLQRKDDTPARPIMSSMARPSSSTGAIIPAPSCRATRCTTSPFSAA
jgi:5-deoxy-glucuronate isomerase